LLKNIIDLSSYPYLIKTTKDGKELYLNPSTNQLCSKELAFANFEGLKNDAKKKVYIDELKLKNTYNNPICNINIINNTNGVSISGASTIKFLKPNLA